LSLYLHAVHFHITDLSFVHSIYINGTFSLYTTLYYGDLKEATCFSCVKQPSSVFILQKYIEPYNFFFM